MFSNIVVGVDGRDGGYAAVALATMRVMLERAHCPVAIAPKGCTSTCPPSRISVA
jgi:hypothetical protein